MNCMMPTLALTLLAGLLQATSVEVSVATIPPNSRVDLALLPEGAAEIRRGGTLSRLKVEIDSVEPLSAFRSDLRAYVLWAVSPEGEFENLGELEPDGRGAALETTTSFERFGLLITAEPHFRVDSPASTVGFRSGPARSRDVRTDTLRAEVGRHDYSGVTLPPQGGIHPRVTQARMAVAVAESEIASETPGAPLRQARVALDSMEQLLRRSTPLDVVLSYANDSIRLSHFALLEARTERDRRTLSDANQRIRELEDALALMGEDRDRIGARERDAASRINALLAELESVREENRSLTLDRDSAERELTAAQAEIRSLRDPWPQLMTALMYGFGARETPAGLLLTLPADAFRNNALPPETREWLSQLAGTLLFSEMPEVWIEGHSSDARGQAAWEERASLVRTHLVAAGIPEGKVFGGSPGSPGQAPEGAAADPLPDRIEIIVREFGAL